MIHPQFPAPHYLKQMKKSVSFCHLLPLVCTIHNQNFPKFPTSWFKNNQDMKTSMSICLKCFSFSCQMIICIAIFSWRVCSHSFKLLALLFLRQLQKIRSWQQTIRNLFLSSHFAVTQWAVRSSVPYLAMSLSCSLKSYDLVLICKVSACFLLFTSFSTNCNGKATSWHLI